MANAISNGVGITVEVMYDASQSNPLMYEFVFAYCITIENFNAFAVQLLNRHWFITDSRGIKREVEGAGVVGKQPIIQPGDRFQYISACKLDSEQGKMWGEYQMKNKNNHQLFTIHIPTFYLEAQFKRN